MQSASASAGSFLERSPMLIRTGRLDDLERLRSIERAAGEAFRSISMKAIADGEPPSVDELAAYTRSGRAWVAADANGEPIGYIIVEEIDSCVHIAQVSVHPRHARQGIGSRLIHTAACWGAANGFTEMTLTTFEHVPWNAPYYERLGFRVVPEELWTEGMRQVVEHEAALGLAAWPRVVMKKRI
jgi:GNAT superfamily N-acetyltransferase